MNASADLVDGRAADVASHPLAALRAIVVGVRSARAHERCDMCAVAIDPTHRHAVDTEERTLRCLCPHCFVLFSDTGAAQGRFRQVPQRVQALGDVGVSQRSWDELQIPVGLAFFFTNSQAGRTVAFYPGPAGATESLLPVDPWEQIVAAQPQLAAVAPDVEAIIIRRHGEAVECYLVPIDACYELVGRLRMTWVGFDGGAEASAVLDGFFARLEERTGA